MCIFENRYDWVYYHVYFSFLALIIEVFKISNYKSWHFLYTTSRALKVLLYFYGIYFCSMFEAIFFFCLNTHYWFFFFEAWTNTFIVYWVPLWFHEHLYVYLYTHVRMYVCLYFVLLSSLSQMSGVSLKSCLICHLLNISFYGHMLVNWKKVMILAMITLIFLIRLQNHAF